MEFDSGYYLDAYGPDVMVNPGRPGYRTRHTSENHRRPPMYHAGSSGYLRPAPPFGAGLHRSVSAAGQRVPVQVTIHNTQNDDHLLVRPRSIHDPEYDYDDHWEERAHTPARREHSRSRSRARAKTHGSRDPSPYYRDFEIEQRLKKLELLEKKEHEEETKKKLEEQMLLKKAKEEAAKAAKEREEKELRKKAVEEDRIKQREKEEKEKREKKEAEEKFREEVKKKFGAAGWSEETIEEILDKGKRANHNHTTVVAVSSKPPTYYKVHREYMLPEVLDMYRLPWEWHDLDSNYIVIKRLISDDFLETLFEESKKKKRPKRLEEAPKPVIVKKGKDLLWVREKQERRRSWFG